MKQIETLIPDIYNILSTPTQLDEDAAKIFATNIVDAVRSSLIQDHGDRSKLRMSSIGIKCDRKLWYQTHNVEGEALPPSARLKFLFGHVLEALLLLLAKAAGHTVTGEQDTVTLQGVKGHRDGVVDGVTTDSKSTSTRSFAKFKDGLQAVDDDFGYLTQLGSYVESGKDDPLVLDKDRGAFLVVDKQFGHLALDIHNFKGKDHGKIFLQAQTAVDKTTAPPRGYMPEADGKSGNEKLGTVCSYCEFKKTCWPGIQTYLYSSGPRYLTTVVREPDVPKLN